jgi:hypothetical protein
MNSAMARTAATAISYIWPCLTRFAMAQAAGPRVTAGG